MNNKAAAWVQACRPATLWAAVVPVVVGSACAIAAGGFRLGPAIAALAGAILIQIGTNLANDVFDAEKGADTADRLGPVRVVAAGILSARAVRRAMVGVFAAAMLVGLYLAWVAGPLVIAIGVASLVSAVAYTGGPWPLGYHGLGDLFVLLFFGFVAVCGTAFVEAGHVPALALWASVPVGALATAILVVNNLRDRVTDARAGKRTLAVRFGRRAGIAEYVGLIAIAHAVPVGLVLAGAVSPWVLATLSTLPLALAPTLLVIKADGRALNPALGATARLLLAHGLLFAAGIALPVMAQAR